MSVVADSAAFPCLFVHADRTEWGVSVLSGESDGKRRYLFEGGEERTMARGPLDLMRKVDEPNRDQQATYARLVALLAKRERPPATVTPTYFARQLDSFNRSQPRGLSAAPWRTDAVWTTPVKKVQQLFGENTLRQLVQAERFGAIWQRCVDFFSEGELASDDVQPVSAKEQQQLLGVAVYQLLYGSDGYERRFDQFIAAYESVFHKPPGWQTATALPALAFPRVHVYVEPTFFRKQLKAFARLSALGSRPNGTSYLRCLGVARTVANLLAASGQIPRDLLDVHHFIRCTVAASDASQASAPRDASAKAP